MLRIGIVIGAYNTRGGLERVAVETARGLAARGHAVTVFTQSVARSQADAAISFTRVGGATRQIALRAATFPFAATRAVRRDRQDVLLSFGSSVLEPAVVRLPGAHRSWWEVANTEWPATTLDGLRRRLNPHHHITMALDARVLGRGLARAVLAAGEWAAADIRRFYPAVADRVSLLPDGVNLDEFDIDPDGRERLRQAWGAEGPVLFTLATELARKGIDTLLEAFSTIRRSVPDATLVIGGRAPTTDVRALVAAHRERSSVRVVGFVDDLRAAYTAADVLMFPTRFDPWGLPVIEAMACGTPVAVSARAGAAQAVEGGRTGSLITDPARADIVAHSTLEALALQTPRAEVRGSIRHLAWDRVVESLEASLIEHAG